MAFIDTKLGRKVYGLFGKYPEGPRVWVNEKNQVVMQSFNRQGKTTGPVHVLRVVRENCSYSYAEHDRIAGDGPWLIAKEGSATHCFEITNAELAGRFVSYLPMHDQNHFHYINFAHIKNGRYDGEWKWFSPNVIEERVYPEGICTLYGRGAWNGNLATMPTKPEVLLYECSVQNGKKDGEERSYYEDGKLAISRGWKQDVLHGSFRWYAPDTGELVVTSEFENNEEVSRKVADGWCIKQQSNGIPEICRRTPQLTGADKAFQHVLDKTVLPAPQAWKLNQHPSKSIRPDNAKFRQ